MENTTLNRLLKWLNENPNDPYLIFVVATEYQKNNLKMARQYYEKLLTKKFENYTFTYAPLANLYVEVGEFDLAEQTYKKGILICQKVKDDKILAELQTAYQDFLADY